MVNEQIVKALTAEDQCRLVDMPGLVPREEVGPPDYFISHAWSNPFSYMVQCVCDQLSGALDTTKASRGSSQRRGVYGLGGGEQGLATVWAEGAGRSWIGGCWVGP